MAVMILRAVRRCLLLLVCLLAAGPSAAVDLVVEAPLELAPLAARWRALDPVQLEGAVRLVGLAEAGPPIRVLLAGEGSLQALSAPAWVAGYALPEQGVVVLFPQRAPRYPDASIEDLLRHEVAHVLVGRASGFRPLPRWFHEGSAMIAGLSWSLGEQARLANVLVRGGEVPLEDLDRRFGGSEGEVQSAYTLAGAFVRDLLRRQGREVLGTILAGVASGLPFENAFVRATGTTLAVAEQTFWERQTFWYRWVPFLTSSVVLWIFITLLALWAMRRRRQRDAAQKAAWEAEEIARALREENLPGPM